MKKLIFLLFLGKIFAEEDCLISQKVKLKALFSDQDLLSTYQASGGNHILFLETSGRDFLDNRQNCAIESASKSTKLPILVLLNSTHLNFGANNATFQIWQNRQKLGVEFFSVENVQEVLQNTPLEGDKVKDKLQKSKTRIHHLSDVLRLASIYKLGGWYFDIDTVIMKDLSAFNGKNVFSTDQNTKNEKLNDFDPEHGVKSLGKI